MRREGGHCGRVMGWQGGKGVRLVRWQGGRVVWREGEKV